MAVNLFITGDKRIGKSSIIKEMVEPHRYAAGGFFTQRIYMPAKDGCAFRIVELSSSESYTLEVQKDYGEGILCNVFYYRESSGICRKNTDVFDSTGSLILEKALESKKPLVVIDEIGRFEEAAQTYVKVLEKLLDSHIHVLGVLQKGTGKLTELIQRRKDTIVLELDVSNSSLIKGKITDFLNDIPGLTRESKA